MANRWQIYQQERFPVLAHTPLIAALSLSAVSFSSLLRGQRTFPKASSLVVAFISLFLFFLQLRIADEFKDQEDDARFRPYRPVPRGLVTLAELGKVGAAAAVLQLGLALWLRPSLVLLLALTWLYLGLMSKEFFIPKWLKAHPVTYLWTHMLIMPLIVLYATACDWLVAGSPRPGGLIWLLVASFFTGLVIEVGRKIRAPEDEEHGVETYTSLWGRRNAVLVWLASMLLAAAAASLAARRVGVAIPLCGVLAMVVMVAALSAWRFLRYPGTNRARHIEHLSGLWTLVTYLGLAAFPLLSRW